MDHTNLENKCIDLANSLMVRYAPNSNRVCNVKDINSDLIVLLFESITKHNIPDLLANDDKEAEAHNVQAVIDTLSLDLLGISLSHITGEDVVAGNLPTVYNLLEVLEGVATYLKSKKQVQQRNQNCIVKRKINRKKKSSSSTSVKSLKSLLQDSPVIDTITQTKKDTRGTSSSTSLTSLPENKKQQSSVSSKSGPGHQISLPSNNDILPSTAGGHSISEYPKNKTSKSPITQIQYDKIEHDIKFKQRIQYQDGDQQATTDIKNNRNQSHSAQITHRKKESVRSKEMPILVERTIRRKICRPLKKKDEQSSKMSQEVEELYEKNFETKVRGLLENNSYKTRASHLKNMHLQSVRKPIRKFPISACKKSFLLPHTLRHRSVTRHAERRKSPRKSRISQNFLPQKGNTLTESVKEGFIQELFDEFPGLQLSPTIISHITQKYQQHLLKMHKQVKDILLRKPKSQVQAEKASKKQLLLDNIIKKDIQQQQHLRELKEHKKFENKIRYKLRDARLQSAKMKQYCDEFHNEMRKKMQKRNFSEELVLENVFKESLKIQKEQVDYLCQEVKETGENDARQHLVYLDALENLYQTQFSMLSESLAAEKRDAQVRANAEQQEMNVMQREFQDELKHEIRFMQKVIVDCMEDIHFREMDAEQFKMKLRQRQ